MNCRICNVPLIENIVTFSNGSKHIELKCKDCGKHYGYKRSIDNKDFKMPFGKFKDKSLSDLPDNYLLWGINNLQSNGLRDRFKEEYKERENILKKVVDSSTGF